MSIDLTTLGIKDKRLSTGQMMAIRRPDQNDVSSLLKYLDTDGAENGNLIYCAEDLAVDSDSRRAYIENAIRDENSLMLIGLVDEKIIAFAYIRTLSSAYISHNCTLSFAVSQPFWHRGIGGTMMRAMIMFARTSKIIKSIHIGVRADSAGLITLYQIYGFAQVGVHKNFYCNDGVYCDQILMDLFV